MNIMKNLTASILIICMFVRLSESEAIASEATHDFINAATSIDYPFNDFRQVNCTGIYSIFSPCYTLQIYTIDINGDGSLEMYDTESMDQTIFNDEDRILPWEDESELPTIGFMIPILRF